MNDNQTAQGPNVKPFSTKVWIASGIVALTVITLWLFKALFGLVLLIFASVMIAIYFLGFADLVQRNLHIPYGWAKAISVIFNLALLVAFFWFVGDQLTQQITSLSETLPQTIQHAKEQLSQTTVGKQLVDQLNSAFSAGKLESLTQRLFSSVYGALSDLYIVLLTVIFFIANPSLYKRGIVYLLPDNAKDKGSKVLDDLYEKLKSWLKGQIIGVFFIGILTGLGLWLIGMPLVFTLALIAGIFNLIPNFGPLIALIPAVLLAFMQGTTTVLLVIAIYQGIQLLQSAVMQPVIQKKMVSMPPALIIISQIALGTLGGFWGLLLATPAVVVLMTIINDVYIKKQTYHRYKM